MNKYVLFSAFISLSLFLSACGIAEGPQQKLTVSVFNFNEGLRWGRYNDVMPIVDKAALEHFTKMHEGWGDSLLISDAEVVQTIYDSKAHKAVVSIRFTWYKKSQMVVNTTVTNQHWEYRDSGWVMMAEEYLSGTPF